MMRLQYTMYFSSKYLLQICKHVNTIIYYRIRGVAPDHNALAVH